ncbi:MAG: hypothetical protein ABIP48_01135 [Planctomycetota bacterium]
MAEIERLSEVQEDLTQKQMTLDSLRGAKGIGSEVKEVKREIKELQDRERELTIEIGRKTHEARPEMPGSGGTYDGLDILRSSMEAKRSQLAEVESQIGARTPSPYSRKRVCIVVGSVLGLAILFSLAGILIRSSLQDTHAKAFGDALALEREINEIIATVEDEASANKAATRIKAFAEKEAAEVAPN